MVVIIVDVVRVDNILVFEGVVELSLVDVDVVLSIIVPVKLEVVVLKVL